MGISKFVTVAAVTAALTTSTPAHAGPTDAWVMVGGGVVAGAGVPDLVDEVVATAGGLAEAAGATCTPRTTRLDVHELRYETWWNAGTAEIAYWWHDAGTATVSSDCASRVDVAVQITDYAPGGRPPVVRGDVSRNSSADASAGDLKATADADLWVIYYSPLSVYQRGSSLVEVKVSGTYYNTRARATLPLGCVVTYTQVTPTPAGPVTGTTTPPQRCAQ